jgi:hypothetical protein
MQQCLVDFWNLATGWVKFDEGQAPHWEMDTDLTTPAQKPGEDWKRGFAVNFYNSQIFDGENVREFATSATGACMAIQALYAEFEEQLKGHHRGEVPIVEHSGATPTKVGKGKTNVPQLRIVGWTARPTGFPDAPPTPAGNLGQTPPAESTPVAAKAEPVRPESAPAVAPQAESATTANTQLF